MIKNINLPNSIIYDYNSYPEDGFYKVKNTTDNNSYLMFVLKKCQFTQCFNITNDSNDENYVNFCNNIELYLTSIKETNKKIVEDKAEEINNEINTENNTKLTIDDTKQLLATILKPELVLERSKK